MEVIKRDEKWKYVKFHYRIDVAILSSHFSVDYRNSKHRSFYSLMKFAYTYILNFEITLT